MSEIDYERHVSVLKFYKMNIPKSKRMAKKTQKIF